MAVCLGLLCAGHSVAPSSLLAQTVRGVLSEEVTEAPINLGTVEAISHAGRVVASTLTNPQGFFELQLPEDGEYILRATALGYTPGRSDAFEIMDDGTLILYVNLRPAPVEITGLVVEADRRDSPDYVPNLTDRGFYRGCRKGGDSS